MPTGKKATSDSHHGFPPTATFSFRFYIRLDTPITNDGYIAHMIFANTASTAEWCLDWRVHTTEEWPPPSGEPQGAYLVVHSYAGRVVGPQFNFNDHIGEWVCYEVHQNFGTKKVNIWVNGKKYIDNVTLNTSYSNANSLSISGFNVTEWLQGHTTYLDNLVVRTDGAYIGPLTIGPGDSSPPNPPENLKVIR